MAEERRSEEVQRWRAKRRAALVLSLLKVETTASVDVTQVPYGADGWGHLTTGIDCHDREVTSFEFVRAVRQGG
jgi:hypothetical protein